MSLRDSPKCAKNKDTEKGYARLNNLYAKNQWENSPSRERMRPRDTVHPAGYSYAPLLRYLNNNIGKPWKKVIQKIPSHLNQYPEWFFTSKLVGDPKAPQQTGPYEWDKFFVDTNGILRKVGRVWKKQHRKPSCFSQEFETYYVKEQGVRVPHQKLVAEVTVIEGQTYARRKGLWYHRIVTGYRDVYAWRYSGSVAPQRIKTGEEPIYKEFQVNGKVQRRLIDIVNKYERSR